MSNSNNRTVKSVKGTPAMHLRVGQVLVVMHPWLGHNLLMSVVTVDRVGDDVVLNQGLRNELTTSEGNLMVVLQDG